MTDGKHTAESVADVLNKAADLIEPEGRWIQGSMARTARGHSTEPRDPEAVCWCANGALGKITGADHESYSEAQLAIRAVTGGGWVFVWNDAPERTQAEVVQALRDAARSAILRATGEEK